MNLPHRSRLWTIVGSCAVALSALFTAAGLLWQGGELVATVKQTAEIVRQQGEDLRKLGDKQNSTDNAVQWICGALGRPKSTPESAMPHVATAKHEGSLP